MLQISRMRLQRICVRYARVEINDYEQRKLREETRRRFKRQKGQIKPFFPHKNLNEIEQNVRTEAKKIIECGRDHTPALALFDSIRKERLPEVEIYNAIFKVLRHAMRMPIAFGIFSDMRSLGVKPNMNTYNELIAGCVKSKLGSEAVNYFQEMQKDSIEPNLLTMISLISAFADQGKTKEGYAVLQKVAETDGWETNVVMYNSLLKGCVKTRDLEFAETLFEEMKKEGDDPDMMTISSMIGVAKACKRLDKLWEYWNELEKSDIKPDLICYNSMLSGLGQLGDLKEVMKFWRGISSFKLRPDANSYSSIMSCCLKNDRNQQVIGLAERMRQDEIALKTVTLNTLLSAYVHMNDWEKVKFLYKRYDRLVDTSVKNQLFSDLYKFEQLDLMDELFSPTKIPVKTKTANFDFHAWSLGVSVAALRHYLPMERGARDITVVVGRGTHSDYKTASKGLLGPRLIKSLAEFDPPIEAIVNPKNEGVIILKKEDVSRWKEAHHGKHQQTSDKKMQ